MLTQGRDALIRDRVMGMPEPEVLLRIRGEPKSGLSLKFCCASEVSPQVA